MNRRVSKLTHRYMLAIPGQKPEDRAHLLRQIRRTWRAMSHKERGAWGKQLKRLIRDNATRVQYAKEAA